MRTRLLLLLALCLTAAADDPLVSAKDRLAARDYAAAVELLSGLRDDAPEDQQPEVRYLYLRALSLAGRHAQVVAEAPVLLERLEGSAWHAKASYLLAESQIARGDFSAAAEIFAERMAALAGEDERSRLAGLYEELADEAFQGLPQGTAGDALHGLERVPDYRRAQRFYRKAAQTHPRPSPRCAFFAARSTAELGQTLAALEAFRGFLDRFPTHGRVPEAATRAGELASSLGDQVFARSLLRTVPDSSVFKPRALEAVGASYRAEGRVELAVEAWQGLLEQHPDAEPTIRVAYALGTMCFEAGRHPLAQKLWTRALTAYPEAEQAADARFLLAQSYLRVQAFDDCRAALRAFLAAHPNDGRWVEGQRQLVRLPILVGERAFADERYDAALHAWRAFLAAAPVDAEAPGVELRIAEALLAADDVESARGQWRSVVAKYPGSRIGARAQLALALSLEGDGSLVAAVAALRRLLEVFPGSPQAREAQLLLSRLQQEELRLLAPRVFASDESVRVEITSRNIDELRYRLYRVDLFDYFSLKSSTDGVERLAIDVVEPDRQWLGAVPGYEDYRRIERSLGLDLPGPGAYLLQVEGGDFKARCVLLQSDLDLVLKVAPEQVLAFCRDRRTGNPWPEAEVHLTVGGTALSEVLRTGPDGVVLERVPDAARGVVCFARVGDHVAFADVALLRTRDFAYSHQVHVSSDRPLYRPGHTVELKTLVREARDGSYRAPESAEVVLRVRDSRGVPIFEHRGHTDRFGALTSSLTLDTEAAVGEYRVTVAWAGQTYVSSLSVEAYRKPELTVAVDATPTAAPGDSLRYSLSARYLFGAPVADATVRWEVRRKGYTFDATRYLSLTWFQSEEKEELLELGQVVARGTTTTDAEGRAAIEIASELREDDLAYVLQAEVVDPSRQVAFGSGRVLVCQNEAYAGLHSEQKMVEQREPLRLTLTTVDAAHRPVSLRGKLEVLRLFDGRDEKLTATLRAATGDDGTATLELAIPEPGTYLLRYRGEDGHGGEVLATAGVTVAGLEEGVESARLLAERQVYRAGETARLLLQSPVSTGSVLLTYEAESLLGYRVISLDGASRTLELTMEPAFAPNVFLSVAIPDVGELHEATDEVYVLRELELELAADAASYLPGETAVFTIAARDSSGVPAEAQLCLALVDEGIFALRPDATPDIRRSFYSRARPHAVHTSGFQGWRFAGRTTGLSADVRDERKLEDVERLRDALQEQMEDLRQQGRFEEREALEELSRQLDERPEQTGGLMLPGDEAPARQPAPEPEPEAAAARPFGGRSGKDDERGETGTYLRQRFVDTAAWLPLLETGADGSVVVRVPLPDNLTRWRVTLRGVDGGSLFGQTTSGIDIRQPLVVQLASTRFLVEGDQTEVALAGFNRTAEDLTADLRFAAADQDLRFAEKIPAGGSFLIDVGVEAAQAGALLLSAGLESPAGDDALQRALAVLPYGVEDVQARTLFLADSDTWSFAPAADARPGYTTLELLLQARGSEFLRSAARSLEAFPYACVEQTVHRFLPSLTLLRALEAEGAPELEERQRVMRIVEGCAAKLVAVQRGDGGFGWWRGCAYDPLMTGFALIGLNEAQREGVWIAPEVLTAARRRAVRSLDEAAPDTAALLLYALSLGAPFDGAWIDRTYRHVPALSPAGLAFLVLAMQEQERVDAVEGLVGLLLRRAVAAGDTLHWPAGGGFSAIEATGYALRALARGGVRADLLDSATRWLETRCLDRAWPSTRDSAAAIQGLCSRLSANADAARPERLTITLQADGRPDSSATLRGASLRELETQANAFLAAHRPAFDGPCSLRLAQEGGAAPLLVSAALRCLLPPETARSSVPGLTLRRSFRPALEAGGYSVLRAESRPEPASPEAVATGEKLEVRLVIETSEDLRYVELADPIPAGCEIAAADPAGVFVHAEARDDRAVFFASSLPKGRHELRYTLRALQPGSYRALPAALAPMYEPGRRALSARDALRVVADASALPAREKTPDEQFAALRSLAAEESHRELLDADFGLLTLDLRPEVRGQLLAWRLAAVRAVGTTAQLVEAFEALAAHAPGATQLSSLELLLELAVAYRDVGELETALSFYRRLFEGYRAVDLELASVYRELGRDDAAQGYWWNVLTRYPDSGPTQASWFAWAQRFADLAEQDGLRDLSGNLPRRIPETVVALRDFVAYFPDSPLCPRAQLLRASYLLGLGARDAAARTALELDARYPESEQRHSALQLASQALFAARDHDRAEEVLRRLLAEEKAAPFHPGAWHLLAQVHHIRGELDAAVAAYAEATGIVDAADALQFLTERRLEMPELVTSAAGREPRLELRTKNLAELSWKVYRVDLPMLLTEELDLADLSIDLSGIPPAFAGVQPLRGAPYGWRESVLPVPLAERGVYLLAARDEMVQASAVILLSDLSLEVQKTAGRTRVYVTSRSTGQPVPGVSLRISDGSRIAARGESDRRGIFETTVGCRAVVAEKGEDYALWRE